MRLIEDAHAPRDIANAISSGDIVLLRGFAGSDLCKDALSEHDGMDLPVLPTPVYQRGLSFRSFFDGGSPIGYTRFYGGASSPNLAKIYQSMVQIAQPTRMLLGGTTDAQESYHLEIFSYDIGVGFSRHRHDSLPQLIGLILLLSDANTGGTVFHDRDEMIDLGQIQRMGDLAIFPWGVEHQVNPAVAHRRVVALLPYY